MKKCNSAFQIEFQMIFPAPVVCASAAALWAECFPCPWMVSRTPAGEYLAPHEMRPCGSHYSAAYFWGERFKSPVAISPPPSPRKLLNLWPAGFSQSS